MNTTYTCRGKEGEETSCTFQEMFGVKADEIQNSNLYTTQRGAGQGCEICICMQIASFPCFLPSQLKPNRYVKKHVEIHSAMLHAAKPEKKQQKGNNRSAVKKFQKYLFFCEFILQIWTFLLVFKTPVILFLAASPASCCCGCCCRSWCGGSSRCWYCYIRPFFSLLSFLLLLVSSAIGALSVQVVERLENLGNSLNCRYLRRNILQLAVLACESTITNFYYVRGALHALTIPITLRYFKP